MDNLTWSRRRFVEAGLATAALATPVARGMGAGAPAQQPIIDSHIHLYDPTRPGGVPWPSPRRPEIYKPALPARYRSIAEPFGVRGAIEVECSPWLEDNQWVLDVAGKDTIMVGTIGDLEPGKPGFGKNLERFHRNPLFRGIRYGNLWGRHFEAEAAAPQFVDDMRLLADAGLTWDAVNPLPPTMAEIVRLTDAVPSLRVVIDHLPSSPVPPAGPPRESFDRSLKLIGERPQIYVKLSEILHTIDGKVPTDLASHRDNLEMIYGTFGPDRVLFGSDWPNCDTVTDFASVMKIAREFIATKEPEVAEKFFWKNSVAAYRWVHRT